MKMNSQENLIDLQMKRTPNNSYSQEIIRYKGRLFNFCLKEFDL